MFIGEYSHSVDEKGRVSIPSKFRLQFSEGVVVTRGIDKCLSVYPRAVWEKMAEKLSQLPLAKKESRAFSRLMLAGAWDAELDSQGRISMPEYLRHYAEVKKHVVVAGLYDRLEIWDEDGWQSYKAKAEAESETIASAMTDLGI